MSERRYVPVDDDLFDAIGAESKWNNVVAAGNTLYVTGQLGWDRKTGKLAESFEEQVELALQNLKHVLRQAGAELSDVVQTRVYLTEHDHYHRYEPIYARFFPKAQPARVSVVVAELIHHALFDIEAIAVVDDFE